MELYEVLVFLHISGVVLLFVAITIETLSGARIRGAADADEVATWAQFNEQATGPLHGVSTLLLAVPGLWMAAIADLWAQGWVQIGIVVLVVAAGVGIGWVTPRLRRIHETATAARGGPVTGALRDQVGDRTLWLVHHALTGLGTGAIFIMATKTGLVASVLWVLGFGGVGLAAGMRVTARRVAPRARGRMA